MGSKNQPGDSSPRKPGAHDQAARKRPTGYCPPGDDTDKSPPMGPAPGD